jgi:hypothetical protein
MTHAHVTLVAHLVCPCAVIMRQAEDRCHRIGQRGSVLIQYLYFEGTSDEILAKALVEKLTAITATIDGDVARSGSSTSPPYRLDFGKHAGEELLDVLASDPFYIDWCISSGVHESRPALRAALESFGKLPSSGASTDQTC